MGVFHNLNEIKKMGEYKFSVYAKWQLGLSILFDGQIVLCIPFVEIRFSVSKHAKGIEIFGRYFKTK